MREIDARTVERILDGHVTTMIRRGDDGSLAMSADKWRLVDVSDSALTFRAEPPAPPDLAPHVIALDDVDHFAWDRLPKQQRRSQVRAYLRNGDVVTFSGMLGDPFDV